MEYFYIWPGLSAVIYALAAMVMKRALTEGFGVIRFTFICNLVLALFFLLPALFSEGGWSWVGWEWATLCGVFFFLGQLTTAFALRYGDVSIQSPLMGSKVVFVALFSAVLGFELVESMWWAAAFMTTMAVFLLGYSNRGKGGKTWISVGFALASAGSFAVSDVFIMGKAESYGVIQFLAMEMVVLLVLSLGLIPFFRREVSSITRTAWRFGLIASGLMAVQAIILNMALGVYQHATPFNVIYSTRGLWSILLVLWIGRQMGTDELGGVHRRLIVRRLLGAMILFVAVVLVFWE